MFTTISNILVNFVILVFLIIMYTYLNKLEQIGCECAQHPYRPIIKSFTIFAFVLIIGFSVITTNFIGEQFGDTAALLYSVLKIVFMTICIVYFYMVLVFTRYLVNEKCKCSDDIRREILTIGSVIEIIVLVLGLMITLILPIIIHSLLYFIQNHAVMEKTMATSLTKPFRTFAKLPSKISKKKLISKSKEIFKSLKSSK
jgi:hypothetical protein